MQKPLPLVLVSVLVSSLVAQAQDVPTPAAAYKNYKASLGILGNPKVIGVQGEIRLLKHFGGRLVATQVCDSHRQNEFSGGGIGLLTYYIPVKNKLVEPVLGIGGVYSLYHWDTGYNQGNLTDFNVGGGVGMNLRFSSAFRTGIHVLVANGFEAASVDGTMHAVGRKLLVMPALTFDVLL